MTLDFKFEHMNFGETYLSTQSHPIQRYLWIGQAGAHNKNVGRNGNIHSSIYLLTNDSVHTLIGCFEYRLLLDKLHAFHLNLDQCWRILLCSGDYFKFTAEEDSIPLFLSQCRSSNAQESTELKMFPEFSQSLSCLWLPHQLCYRDHMRTIARLSCLPPSNPSANTHVSESSLKLTESVHFSASRHPQFLKTPGIQSAYKALHDLHPNCYCPTFPHTLALSYSQHNVCAGLFCIFFPLQAHTSGLCWRLPQQRSLLLACLLIRSYASCHP